MGLAYQETGSGEPLLLIHGMGSAKDLGTGKEQSVRISAPKKLSKEEIEKIVAAILTL